MSGVFKAVKKVVKGVGKAIGKVFKGVGKFVKKVAKPVLGFVKKIPFVGKVLASPWALPIAIGGGLLLGSLFKKRRKRRVPSYGISRQAGSRMMYPRISYYPPYLGAGYDYGYDSLGMPYWSPGWMNLGGVYWRPRGTGLYLMPDDWNYQPIYADPEYYSNRTERYRPYMPPIYPSAGRLGGFLPSAGRRVIRDAFGGKVGAVTGWQRGVDVDVPVANVSPIYRDLMRRGVKIFNPYGWKGATVSLPRPVGVPFGGIGYPRAGIA